jgi:hypothetical protein
MHFFYYFIQVYLFNLTLFDLYYEQFYQISVIDVQVFNYQNFY